MDSQYVQVVPTLDLGCSIRILLTLPLRTDFPLPLSLSLPFPYGETFACDYIELVGMYISYAPRARNCVTCGSFFLWPDIPPFTRITSNVVTASQRNVLE